MAEDNILASNLAQLGGQISSTFQTVALQNQYKNALPGMQEAFKSAMTDFDSGKSGAGFSKIMAIAMENPNNPYIQNVTQMAFKAGQFASDDYFKGQQIGAMKARYGGGGGSEVTAEDIVTGLNARDGITPDVTEDEIVDPDVAASMSAGAKGLPIRQSIMARQQRIQQQGIQQPTLTPYLAFKQEQPQEQPSPLEITFQKKFDDWSSMPLEKQKAQDEATSISFGSESDLSSHVSKLPRGQKFVAADPSLQSVIPGVTGFILPEKFSQWAKKGVTIGKSISQTIGKEDKLADESKKSAEWFDAFSDASVIVDANPRLRNLLKDAGGVANIEYQTVKRPPTDEEKRATNYSAGMQEVVQASIRGSKLPPIEITKDEAQDLQTLKTKAAAMQTMGAKAVINRSSIKKPEAVTPAPKSAGQRKELKSIFLK